MKNRWHSENLTLHILAALLAVVLWSFVKTADLPTRADSSQTLSNIPLEVRDIPSGLQVTNELPTAVSVTLRGATTTLEQVSRDQLVAYISLAEASEGTGQFAVKVANPEGLSATAHPSRVEVRLEQVLSADFTVKPLIIGGAEDRYAYVALKSASVKVTGVRSQLTSVSQAVVLVDLQGVNVGDKLDLQLPVRLRDAAGQELKQLVVDPGTVQATVQLFSGKKVAVEPVFRGDVAEGFRLDSWRVEPESVIVYGSAASLESLQSIQTRPVDLTGINTNTAITVELVLPTGIVAVQPTGVELSLQVKRTG